MYTKISKIQQKKEQSTKHNNNNKNVTKRSNDFWHIGIVVEREIFVLVSIKTYVNQSMFVFPSSSWSPWRPGYSQMFTCSNVSHKHISIPHLVHNKECKNYPLKKKKAAAKPCVINRHSAFCLFIFLFSATVIDVLSGSFIFHSLRLWFLLSFKRGLGNSIFGVSWRKKILQFERTHGVVEIGHLFILSIFFLGCRIGLFLLWTRIVWTMKD